MKQTIEDQRVVGAETFLPFENHPVIFNFHLVGQQRGGLVDRLVDLLVETLTNYQIDGQRESAKQRAHAYAATDQEAAPDGWGFHRDSSSRI
ncbi:MAG: hypothetical protein MUF86_17145 [Akkermansiaceae bacterium]|nr:hypothetical protein [Akkermansiaceae bacterium]